MLLGIDNIQRVERTESPVNAIVYFNNSSGSNVCFSYPHRLQGVRIRDNFSPTSELPTMLTISNISSDIFRSCDKALRGYSIHRNLKSQPIKRTRRTQWDAIPLRFQHGQAGAVSSNCILPGLKRIYSTFTRMVVGICIGSVSE